MRFHYHTVIAIFFLFYTALFISGCARNQVIKTHGISYLEKREKLIILNKSNKNDTVQILGQPATKGMTNDNMWIYIERTKTRGTLLKLGRNYLKKNNVLLLEFNKFGVVTKKQFYDKDKMQEVNFAKTFTANDLKKENFIYSFLSSLRQKMQSQRK